MKPTFVATFALGILSWALAAGAAQLQGTISDVDGTPLAGANIIVTGGGLDRPHGAVSGSSGQYVVGGLADGAYDVEVSHIGYRPWSRARVQVRGTTTLDIGLDPAVIDLEMSVVSASRTKEKALDAPASISIVEAEEIGARSALSVSEHVRDQPGIDFAKTGLVQSNVVTRGFNNIFSGAMLTLSDNRIARVPSLRVNANNFIPVTNEDIERIEVVLGPGAALYGPNSANGVMHIITRSPFASAGTSVSLGAGERSLASGSVRHAGVVNPYVGYKISAQYYTGTDWKYVDPEEALERQEALDEGADPATLRIGARDYDIERQSLEARVDVRPAEDLTAIVSYGYNRSDHIEQTGLGAGQARGWTYNYLQTRLVYEDWFAQYYHNWSDANDTYLLRTGDPIVDKSTLDVFQVQHSAYLGTRQSFTYGFDALLTRPQTKGTITGGNENDDDIDEYGAYLQSGTQLTDQLELVLALRYDDHNRLEDAQVSPRAGLVYKARETESIRLTYNRAFSTPTTNELYLDLVAIEGAFEPLDAFAPVLGFNPNVDVRAQGNYRPGHARGLTFRRTADGRAMYRSSFEPAIAGQLALLGLSPGDAGYSIQADRYIAMDDPIATNVQWNIGRGAVLNEFVPALQGLAPALIAGQLLQLDPTMDPAAAQAIGQEQAAQVAAALPGMVPLQLPGLTNRYKRLNQETRGFDDVARAVDVPQQKATITQTLELGYKGIVAEKWVVSADVYRSEVEDFVGPLKVETPNVFLDSTALASVLEPAFTAQLADPANAAAAGVLAALDQLSLPGLPQGDNDGSAADELAALFAGGAGQIPFGTVSPEQAYDPTAVLLTYRNFGDVTLYGLDLAVGFYPNEQWNVTGSYSYVNDDFFPNLGGIADVALNAPKHKFNVGGTYRLPEQDLRLGARVRYTGSFPVSSGVYEGDVDSHTSLDLSARYGLPFGEGLHLLANVDNALDSAHRGFIGAPEVGRLASARLVLDF